MPCDINSNDINCPNSYQWSNAPSNIQVAYDIDGGCNSWGICHKSFRAYTRQQTNIFERTPSLDFGYDYNSGKKYFYYPGKTPITDELYDLFANGFETINTTISLPIPSGKYDLRLSSSGNLYTLEAKPIKSEPVYTSILASLFAQTPTENSPPEQVATKGYVDIKIAQSQGDDCSLIAYIEIPELQRQDYVCLKGKVIEKGLSNYFVQDFTKNMVWQERYEAVGYESISEFQSLISKSIIGVQVKYEDGTVGICAFLIPNKLAIGVGLVSKSGDDNLTGSIIYANQIFPYFVRDTITSENLGNWNRKVYGRFWTGYIVSRERLGNLQPPSSFESNVIEFKNLKRGINSLHYYGREDWAGGWGYDFVIYKNFDGMRFILEGSDKFYIDYAAIARKAYVGGKCSIRLYYIK
ncbi:MAG: hypothetical protein QW649_04905 [Thermoplasmata archaeon]